MHTLNKPHSDVSLIERLTQGDQAAFEILYERYFARLFNYAVAKTGDRFLAQEIVQELFINLWQQREKLTLTTSVEAYIFTTAKHLIIDQYRRESTRTRYQDAFINRQPLVSNQTEEQIQADELRETYERLLSQLPEKCRRVFTLSRQGYSHREVARLEDIAQKTVEQHISRALRLLREHLPEHLILFIYLSFIL